MGGVSKTYCEKVAFSSDLMNFMYLFGLKFSSEFQYFSKFVNNFRDFINNNNNSSGSRSSDSNNNRSSSNDNIIDFIHFTLVKQNFII